MGDDEDTLVEAEVPDGYWDTLLAWLDTAPALPEPPDVDVPDPF